MYNEEVKNQSQWLWFINDSINKQGIWIKMSMIKGLEQVLSSKKCIQNNIESIL